MKIQFGGNHCKKHNFWLGPHSNKCLAGGAPLLPPKCCCMKGWLWGLSAPNQRGGGKEVPPWTWLIFHSVAFHSFCAPWPRGGWGIQPLKKPLSSSSGSVFLFAGSDFASWCAADVKSLLLGVPRGTSLFPLSSWIVWAGYNWGWKSFHHLLHSLWDFTATSDQHSLSSVLCCRGWALSLVPCVTKGDCPCPALSRALGGCIHTQEQLNTYNAFKEGFWPLWCWVLAPQGWNCHVTESPKVRRIHCKFTLFYYYFYYYYFQQDHYSVTTSLPGESSLQAQ